MGKRALVAHRDPDCRTTLITQLAPLGVRVVAEATDGLSVIASAIELQPDIVFLAPDVAHLDGWATARHLRQRVPGCTICLLPAAVGESELARMADGTIDGYLLCPRGRQPDASALHWLSAKAALSECP